MASQMVMTVLGPVQAEQLGVTTIHEHVFVHMGSYFTESEDDPEGTLAAKPVTTDLLWFVRTHPTQNRDNVVQDSLDVALAEVAHFREAGGKTLVDVTPIGLGRDPSRLVTVAKTTGVQIVAGTGFYFARTLPPAVADLSVEELADHFRRELTEGMAGTNVRAGLIGELALSNPVAPIEKRVLLAAARVQRELDCAVFIHPIWGGEGAKETARLAEAVGLNPRRTVLCHLDTRFGDDVDAYREVGIRGFWLALDSFGREAYFPHADTQFPADTQRIHAVLGVLDAGLGDRLLLAQDVSFKHELVQFGGHGYAHVLRTICPRLRRSGVDETTLTRILVDNPRAVFTDA